MGKKINPKIFRLGINKTWTSKWFGAGENYRKKLQEDVQVRRFLMRELKEASVDRVEIERSANRITIIIHSAKPGMIIGRGGNGIEELKKKVHRAYLKKYRPGNIALNIVEFDRPNLSAQIVTQSIIADIEKRIPFRRAMKQGIGRVERAGALGTKIIISGRLNGAEIAREEMLTVGKVPLHTLRADIDYARGTASTTYGTIGVKVWIYKGEVFERSEKKSSLRS